MELNIMRKKPYTTLFQFAVPSVIGMLLTSLITIVDGIFIGQMVGEKGLAAVNLGLPILYLFLGVTIMVSVGGSTLAVHRLGAKENISANNVFNQTITTLLCLIIIVAALAKILLRPLQHALQIDATTLVYMNDYYKIMLMVYPVMMLNMAFGMFIRGEGIPELFMKINILTVTVNVVLDAVLIVKYNMGVVGAAYASGISVITGLVFLILHFIRDKSKFKIGVFKFNKQDFKNTILNGFSELIGQLSMSVTTGLLNAVILNIIGVVGVAAMTIVGYVSFIFNMIIIGIGQGMGPIVSYSYGAEEFEFMFIMRKISQKVVFICGALFFIIMNLGCSTYADIFSDSIDLQLLVVKGMRICSVGFLVAGYNVIASFFFTSIGKAKNSAVISAMRGLILLTLNIIILPLVFKELGIWLVFPVTEIEVFIIAILIVYNHKQ